jgi:hypothetical protein
MLSRIREFLGGTPNNENPVGETNVVEPPHELSQARLEELLGATLRELEDEARVRAERGEAVGRVVEVRDHDGRTVDLRRRTYSSLIEAGADARRAAIEEQDGIDSPRSVEIASLWPLVRRRALLDALGALGDVEPVENAPQRPQRPVFEPSLSLGEGNSAGQAVRDLRRAAAERELARFEDRQAEKQDELRRGGAFSDFSERVKILDALNRWAEAHPQLQDAIDARGGVA